MNYNLVNGMNIILDEKYPSIDYLKKNKDLAYKIKKIYSGKNSEMTTINNYVYQKLILDDDLKEIKDVLEKIAIVEMQHLDLLGKMIKKLGLYPSYTFINKKGNEVYWDTSFVNYETDLKKILINNIKSEEKSIKEYKDIIKYASDEIITNVFNRIILDEEQHIKIFKSILNNLI